MSELEFKGHDPIDNFPTIPVLDEKILAEVSFPEREKLSACTFECLSSAERKIFADQRDKLPEDLRAFLTPWSVEEYAQAGVRLFLHHTLRAGYGLHDGELISVFSLPGAGLGREVVLDAIERGAVRLDCLVPHEKLRTFYESCGFIETKRLQWDDRYAPVDWNYERFGKPDLIFMELESL
ncbi:MAG: hypothetical protein RL417_433 [Pseudomonadota bacterium]|jgi:hypothetical protein